MTYLRFHFYFNLPILVILGLLSLQKTFELGELTPAGLVLLAVFIFTTPWDNLAAKWGIWGFPEGRYWFKIGYLPLEEYSFFLLQSVNVMLLERMLLVWKPSWELGMTTEVVPQQWYFLALSILPWLATARVLTWVRGWCGPRVNYALHLAWFFPVIYAQWVIAPHLFLAYLPILFIPTLAFGTYYTLADIIAVRAGTWYIDDKQSTGLKLAGILPWEEAAFFYLTSLLVAQSYLLLLPSEYR